MSEPIHKAGEAAPFLTVYTKTSGDRLAAEFTIEGEFAVLEALNAAQIKALLPTGYEIATAQLKPSSVGLGQIIVRSNGYNGDAVTNLPIRTTFTVEMAEVMYELVNHPKLAGTPRDLCLAWLATDEAARLNSNGDPQYLDATGAFVEITDEWALRFVAAYRAGITTFNRYYPVVEKHSTYSNPPGMSMSGASFTGGAPTFSPGIGTFDDPPLTLNGYPSGHWFKSKDSWVENANRTWTRTEQWTYTPDGSDGPHAWIYAAAGNGDDEGGGAA